MTVSGMRMSNADRQSSHRRESQPFHAMVLALHCKAMISTHTEFSVTIPRTLPQQPQIAGRVTFPDQCSLYFSGSEIASDSLRSEINLCIRNGESQAKT